MLGDFSDTVVHVLPNRQCIRLWHYCNFVTILSLCCCKTFPLWCRLSYFIAFYRPFYFLFIIKKIVFVKNCVSVWNCFASANAQALLNQSMVIVYIGLFVFQVVDENWIKRSLNAFEWCFYEIYWLVHLNSVNILLFHLTCIVHQSYSLQITRI